MNARERNLMLLNIYDLKFFRLFNWKNLQVDFHESHNNYEIVLAVNMSVQPS